MLNRMHIHIADDDRDDASMLSELICAKYPHAKLEVSENGRQLLESLRKTEVLPDLLFLDINMPQMNGFDSIQMLKADPRFSNIKTVIYSTSGNFKDIEKMYEEGADFYLEKPRDINLLDYLIENLFYRVFEEKSERPGRDEFLLGR